MGGPGRAAPDRPRGCARAPITLLIDAALLFSARSGYTTLHRARHARLPTASTVLSSPWVCLRPAVRCAGLHHFFTWAARMLLGAAAPATGGWHSRGRSPGLPEA